MANKLTLHLVVLPVLCGIVAGCASSRGLKKIEDAPLLPIAPGKDLGRFEVREQQRVADKDPRPAKPVVAVTDRKKEIVIDKGADIHHSSGNISNTRSDTKKVFEYPNRRPQVDPIWIGEKASYDITYLGVSAGTFTLQALPFKEINERKVYHIFGEAVSGKVFSLFYSLKDTIETFIDYQSLAPHRFHVVLDESKQKRNSLELYDSEKGETFFWNRWNHHKKGYVEVKDFFPMQPLSQDSLSSLYYLRTVDLSDGAVVKFPVVSEGKNWDAEVTVVKRELLDTRIGKIRAIKLQPETKYQGILKKQGDSFLWLSDDDRRILLRLEAKVRIGSVVASIQSFEKGQKEEPVMTPVQVLDSSELKDAKSNAWKSKKPANTSGSLKSR
ncbi:MAG: DUF3108 domain-containing protein [Bdellovibrionales bacterium]|nr:DUF3108 domain-containing protein [Bdellovibrionales bacterium]